MSNILNLSINLASYASSGNGTCSVTNSPQMTNFRWARSVQNIPADNVLSQSLEVAASATTTLFTGSDIRKFLYLETDSQLSLLINGTITQIVNPIVIGSSTSPGVFMCSCDITSLVVTNTSSTDEANVFFATIE